MNEASVSKVEREKMSAATAAAAQPPPSPAAVAATKHTHTRTRTRAGAFNGSLLSIFSLIFLLNAAIVLPSSPVFILLLFCALDTEIRSWKSQENTQLSNRIQNEYTVQCTALAQKNWERERVREKRGETYSFFLLKKLAQKHKNSSCSKLTIRFDTWPQSVLPEIIFRALVRSLTSVQRQCLVQKSRSFFYLLFVCLTFKNMPINFGIEFSQGSVSFVVAPIESITFEETGISIYLLYQVCTNFSGKGKKFNFCFVCDFLFDFQSAALYAFCSVAIFTVGTVTARGLHETFALSRDLFVFVLILFSPMN